MSRNKLNIILNGNPVTGFENESVLDLARRHGIEIPTLCHDPRLDPFSSCFVCVVEIEGMKGFQPSCSTRLSDGMKITTDNEAIYRSRKMALELLLSNHYADCTGPCKETCPAGVDVQGYISLIEKGQYSEAVKLIKQTNPLPAICGRVCVRPCEAACRRNLTEEKLPVGIDYLKRFTADQDLLSGHHYKPEVKPASGKKVAIIGAGPGGLSAAYWLAQEGHQIDIFEAMPQAGGWLRYGIPEYRLPNDIIDREISTITELGVKIHTGKKLGDNLSYKEINQKYDACLLTIGSQKGTLTGVDGDDAINVFSGIDFLRNMNVSGQQYDFSGKTIAVVGGGNTAMDCCRTSIRSNAEKVYVIYRRTEAEMPANPIEIHESRLEGVEYLFLTNPVKINKDKEGILKSITCTRMELGEPDSSGRRRPVPVEGSDFEIRVDYLLAAIGQKTDVNFIDDINNNADGETLIINKWGDIEVNRMTFQTSIPRVFAAGDGVSGPATVIEAIAQAKIAALSCHQLLSGEKFRPVKKEFFSRKENFKKQVSEDYEGQFETQSRCEMPVLPAERRMNFDEVELGYTEAEAKRETARCLECGCSALYECELKKYASEYQSEQKHYHGKYNEFKIDFSHPHIEIDNNKCILCGRCIRICREIAGANALGFVNRGFKTFVAPSMELPLTETNCEDCGLCLSTCPTGALSERKPFKQGPVKKDTFTSICSFCSVGCTLKFHHKNGFIMGVSGTKGAVNKNGNICGKARFGYHYFNSTQKITTPLIRKNGKLEECSRDEAYKILREKLSGIKAEEIAISAGANCSNEELYLIQKAARVGIKTNHLFSFHYAGRGEGYNEIGERNVALEDIKEVSAIYILGGNIKADNPVAGFLIQTARHKYNIPVTLISETEHHPMENKCDQVIKVKSVYYFLQAANRHIAESGEFNSLYLENHVSAHNEYLSKVRGNAPEELLKKAGIEKNTLAEFARAYNETAQAILVISENTLSSSAAIEAKNLALLCGKAGKTAAGLLTLKEKNNSQGLKDMGFCPHYTIGGAKYDESARKYLEGVWQSGELAPAGEGRIVEKLKTGKIKALIIFNEDPVGCAADKAEMAAIMDKPELKVVFDSVMSPTAEQADIVFPWTFNFETGGSYTNTEKRIQIFEKALVSPSGTDNISILNEFGRISGINCEYDSFREVQDEWLRILARKEPLKPVLMHTHSGQVFSLVKHGGDLKMKLYEQSKNETV